MRRGTHRGGRRERRDPVSKDGLGSRRWNLTSRRSFGISDNGFNGWNGWKSWLASHQIRLIRAIRCSSIPSSYCGVQVPARGGLLDVWQPHVEELRGAAPEAAEIDVKQVHLGRCSGGLR